jgi:glutathione peroxidase
MRSTCPSPTGIFVLSYYSWTPVSTTDVAWNFEKVLLDASLTPVKRYGSITSPSAIAPDIQKLLG